MKQRLLLGTIIALLFGACGRTDVRLHCADELIEQNLKDSASLILAGIKHPGSFSESDRALYALLAAEVARNENRLGEIDTLLLRIVCILSAPCFVRGRWRVLFSAMKRR